MFKSRIFFSALKKIVVSSVAGRDQDVWRWVTSTAWTWSVLTREVDSATGDWPALSCTASTICHVLLTSMMSRWLNTDRKITSTHLLNNYFSLFSISSEILSHIIYAPYDTGFFFCLPLNRHKKTPTCSISTARRSWYTELSSADSRFIYLFEIYISHHSDDGKVWNSFTTVTTVAFHFLWGVSRPPSQLTPLLRNHFELCIVVSFHQTHYRVY